MHKRHHPLIHPWRILIITALLLLLSLAAGILTTLSNDGERKKPRSAPALSPGSPAVQSGNGPILGSFSVDVIIPDNTSSP